MRTINDHRLDHTSFTATPSDTLRNHTTNCIGGSVHHRPTVDARTIPSPHLRSAQPSNHSQIPAPHLNPATTKPTLAAIPPPPPVATPRLPTSPPPGRAGATPHKMRRRSPPHASSLTSRAAPHHPVTRAAPASLDVCTRKEYHSPDVFAIPNPDAVLHRPALRAAVPPPAAPRPRIPQLAPRGTLRANHPRFPLRPGRPPTIQVCLHPTGPSSRPLTAPTFVANPTKNPAQTISRQPESPLGIQAGER